MAKKGRTSLFIKLRDGKIFLEDELELPTKRRLDIKQRKINKRRKKK